MIKVNIKEKLQLTNDYWKPIIVGGLNNPKGIKHKPVAGREAHLLLFKPESVLNTGDIRNELTHESQKKHF